GADEHVADVGDVAAGGEIHDRVGAVLEAGAELHQLAVDVARHLAVADVRVDLAGGGDADRHRLELGMVDVGGNDHATPRHLATHGFHGKPLAARDVLHLLGRYAETREVHLGDVRTTAPLFDPACTHGGFSRGRSTVTAAAGSANRMLRPAASTRRRQSPLLR